MDMKPAVVTAFMKVHAQSIPKGITPQDIFRSLDYVQSLRDEDTIYPIFEVADYVTAKKFARDIATLATIDTE